MKIVVAIDSFKGSASSSQLNEAVATAIHATLPTAEVETFTIADGGEGTLEALSQALTGEFVAVETVDLLGRVIQAPYFISDKTAFIESASVVGIDKITPSPDTVEQASSFGLGALVKDALRRECDEIILTLGGTGTSDGGRGLLEALQFELGQESPLRSVHLVGLTDVENVYAGENGYAKIFGAQKGATPEQLDEMDRQAQAFVATVQAKIGLDLQAIQGTGAAGGLGGAVVLLGGSLQSGFATIAEKIGIEEAIVDADLVITGEGRLDTQSLKGKVPVGIARLAKKHKVPVIAVCGAIADTNDQLEEMFLATYSIQTAALPLVQAMEIQTTLSNLNFVVRNILRTRFGK